MKIMLNSTFKLYFFITLIALGLTLFIASLLPNWFDKYKANIKKDTRSIPNPNIFYHDFDHDGFSEMAALKYQKDIDESALKVYAYNDGLIDQWNFKERWLQRSIIFGDYDHDGHDEAYVFTQNRDSLFLYVIDPEKPAKFILWRAFITRSLKHGKRWDLRPIAGVLVDSDSDGYKDLIFNVMAGASVFPRRLYVFSIQKKRVLFRSPKSIAFLANPTKIDISDKENKILIQGSVALNNADRRFIFNDHFAWLTVFTPKLKFAFPPIPFKGRNTHLRTLPFGNHNRAIICLINYGNKESVYSDLMLYDWQGNLLKRKELHGQNWELFQETNPYHRETYLIDKKENMLYRLTDNLTFDWHRKYHGLVSCIISTAFDVDGDFQKEWIAKSGKKLLILKNYMHDVYTVNIPLIYWGNINFSLRKNGTKPPSLSVQTGNDKYLIRYYLNPLYPFHYSSRFIIFLFSFLFVWAIVSFYNFLSGSNSILNALLHNPDRGLMILKDNGNILYLNHTIINQFNLPPTAYKGKSVFKLFPDSLSLKNIFQKIIDSTTELNQDVSFQNQSVNLKARIFSKPIKVLFDYTYGYFVEINDYSKPVQDDRLKVWSKTVQKMAHDIKAPLSSININMMTLNLKLADMAPEAHQIIEPELKLIVNEINRVKERTINFLKFTNLEKPRLDWINIQELFQQILELFKNYSKESLEIKLEIADDVDRIYVDAQQIKMALQAIIENAIDAMRAEGIIEINISKINPLDKQFREYIEIDIADTGPGIPQKIREKIFEPYFTTKKEGTGMGMSITKKIIMEHQGEISIYSSENFSTVIKILLPFGNDVARNQQN